MWKTHKYKEELKIALFLKCLLGVIGRVYVTYEKGKRWKIRALFSIKFGALFLRNSFEISSILMEFAFRYVVLWNWNGRIQMNKFNGSKHKTMVLQITSSKPCVGLSVPSIV